MSQATTFKLREQIKKVIPLREQIKCIQHRITELDELNRTCRCAESQARYELKINFWSNVLRNLETLQSQQS